LHSDLAKATLNGQQYNIGEFSKLCIDLTDETKKLVPSRHDHSRGVDALPVIMFAHEYPSCCINFWQNGSHGSLLEAQQRWQSVLNNDNNLWKGWVRDKELAEVLITVWGQLRLLFKIETHWGEEERVFRTPGHTFWSHLGFEGFKAIKGAKKFT
jgi:hypothetical protein